MRQSKYSDEMNAALRNDWNAGMPIPDIREKHGFTRGQLAGRMIQLSLHPRTRAPYDLSDDNPAIVNGRTLFPARVKNIADVGAVAGLIALKPGCHSTKLGGKITKGAWKGLPVFSLTLEERKTCPRSCLVWNGCYGNNSQWATRFIAGAELENRLSTELRLLSRRYAGVGGYVVRLHVLGDFYSPRYVYLWKQWLRDHPRLRVWGYSAHPRNTEIGKALAALRRSNDRFRLRFSGIETVVVDEPEDVPRRAILCPVQTGKTLNCGTCALCWSTDKTIAFLRH